MKNCPFCKNEIGSDEQGCPHCHRVLIEKMYRLDHRNIKERIEKSSRFSQESRGNLLIKTVKRYPVITLTILFFFSVHIYFLGINFSTHSNLLFWMSAFLFKYSLYWLLVVYVASKLPFEKLKQRFIRHPITTLFILVVLCYDLTKVIIKYGPYFEGVLSKIFVYFLLWLLISWFSNKFFKKQRFQWGWYQKIIDVIFICLPIIYKIIFALVIAYFLIYVIFFSIINIFNYSGNDLDKLFY